MPLLSANRLSSNTEMQRDRILGGKAARATGPKKSIRPGASVRRQRVDPEPN
jgi:hypothetical protein